MTLASPSTAHSQADGTDEARASFIAGSNLARMGDWQGALVQYRASLAHRSAPITFFSLALTEETLGLFVEARDHYEAFLAEPSTAFTEPYERAARASLRELERQIGHIEIVVEPAGLAGVTLTMDGGGPSALLAGHEVNPGQHVVVGSAPGAASTALTLNVAPGETVRATLRLAPMPPSPIKPDSIPVSGPRARMEPAEPRSDALPTVVLVGGGALFTVGATVGILGIRAAEEAPTSDGRAAQDARVRMTAGDIIGGVGLAAAGAGLVLLLWPEAESEATPSARVRPWLRAGALGLEGGF